MLAALTCDSLYTLVIFESFYLKVRSFINWLPIGILWAFLTGYYFDLVAAQTNELGRGTLVFIALAFAYFCGYVLQHNLFLLKKPWENGEVRKVKWISMLIYLVSLAIAFAPYVIFHSLTGINSWIFLFLLLPLIFFCKYWDGVHKVATGHIKELLTNHLRSYCQRSFVEFSQTDDDTTIMLNAEFRELLAFLEVTCKSLSHVMMFRPTQGGQLIPTLKDGVLSPRVVKQICAEVQKSVLVELSTRREKLTILLGSDVQADESRGLVAQKCGENVAASLFERRTALNGHRQTHQSDIVAILQPKIF
jgi:hypothetical protein